MVAPKKCMSYELPLVELLDSLSKEGIDTRQLNIVEEIEMTKTKLQIMREKADMTIEQLAIFALIIQYENRWCYPSTLETFKETIDGTIKVLEKFEKTNTNIDRSNKNWKYIAQALGCSVDELMEE